MNVNGGVVGKGTFEPGWKWSTHVKPIAKTALCETPHFQYILSGKMKLVTADGDEYTVAAGDVIKIGAGHDAWVEGNEAVVAVDFQGMADYAKSR
ncbi:MAG: cupin domain-containing protein [Elusimicrobiota bacterium]